MQQLILQRSLKLIEKIYDDSMYGSTDIFRIKDVVHSFDEGQWLCKQWLADQFSNMYGPDRRGKIVILGGWYGLAAYTLRQKFSAQDMHIVSIDSDPRCEEFGWQLFPDQDIEFVTADAREEPNFDDCSAIISTSVEHFDRDELLELIRKKPKWCKVALQSNNMFDHPSHINCSKTLDEFAEYITPALGQGVVYKGELTLRGYKRFMVIGR